MSVEVSGWVWEHSQASGNDLIVLLKIADNANADGGGAYPGVDYLARAGRISKRAVYDCLRRLKTSGELVEEAEGGGRGRKTTYRVLMGNGAEAAPIPDQGNGAARRAETVQPAALNGADPGIAYKEEPSLNRPRNRPSAGKPSAEGGAKKPGRPKAEPPEAAWALARLLAESVERRFPQFGKPKVGVEWAREIDLLMRKGPPGFDKGLDERQVRKLVDWLGTGQGHRAAFWAQNVRSAAKLREKAPELVAGWHEDHGMTPDGSPLPRPGHLRPVPPPVPEADLSARPPLGDVEALEAWANAELERAAGR